MRDMNNFATFLKRLGDLLLSTFICVVEAFVFSQHFCPLCSSSAGTNGLIPWWLEKMLRKAKARE